jgi:hypothetical protein
MNKESIKETIIQITEALEPLAEKLGTTAEHLWKIAIKQVYVEAIQLTFSLLVLCLFLYLYYRFIRWGTKKEESGYSNRFDDNSVMAFFAAISGIILATLFLVNISLLVGVIPQVIINPEWKAIKNIFNLINGCSY